MKFLNPNEYGSLLYDKKEEEYVNNVIKQRRIFRYSRCEYNYTSLCEEKISSIVNRKYSLLVTSGTSGLKAALVGAGVKENDRVLISSYTFLATALAVISLGAIPIPIEFDLETGLDLDEIKTEIKKGCKAIICVHFQGRAFNLKKLCKVAHDNNIVLIEDACQAFGAKYKSKYAGTFGDIGVYSFQQFKQISCGEGGCIVTNNKKMYKRMRNYTDMGSVRDRFPNWNSSEALFGENYRMNNLVAAVLYAQLEKLNYIIESQSKIRKSILNKLNIKNIINSSYPNGDTCMNILIKLNNKKYKKDAIEIGKEHEIEFRNMWSSLYYDNKLFKKNKYDSISLKNKDCIKTRDFIDKMLVISIPPTISKVEEDKIIEVINILKERKMVD